MDIPIIIVTQRWSGINYISQAPALASSDFSPSLSTSTAFILDHTGHRYRKNKNENVALCSDGSWISVQIVNVFLVIMLHAVYRLISYFYILSLEERLSF